MSDFMRVSLPESLLLLYARCFPIRRGKLRVIDSLWRVAVRDKIRSRTANLKYGGFEMTCDLNRMLQRQFYFFGTYFMEEKILDCWRRELGQAKIVFDIGANSGIYSLAALAAQPDVDVYAFEPTPEIAEHLRRTAVLNRLGRLHVQQMAVSEREGRASLKHFYGETGLNEGMNFIVTETPEQSGEERVETVSLDKFCEKSGIEKIDFLKLDIQGHEPFALRGADRLLREARIGTIFMELNWAQNSAENCPATESIFILGRAGYKFSLPGKHLNWQEPGEWMRNCTDIIARRA